MPPGRSDRGRSEAELQALLADAHRAVVDRLDTDRQPPTGRAVPRGRVHRGWLLACVVAWLAVLAVAVAPPAALRAPAARPFRPPPGLEEASLRWGMWLARQRVEAHRLAAERLPSRLGETGFDDPEITLEVLTPERYRLIARHGEVELVLDDRTDADRFLGSALEELQAVR